MSNSLNITVTLTGKTITFSGDIDNGQISMPQGDYNINFTAGDKTPFTFYGITLFGGGQIAGSAGQVFITETMQGNSIPVFPGTDNNISVVSIDPNNGITLDNDNSNGASTNVTVASFQIMIKDNSGSLLVSSDPEIINEPK